MRNRIYSSTFLVSLFVLFLVIPVGQSAFGQDCTSLADLRIEDTNLLSATEVPSSGDLPEYCRVLGYVRPAINFEIRLPTTSWNGKFFMAGCGGFCGKLESNNSRINAMNIGLKRNYAASTTDAGHWGEDLFDGRWAYNNRQAEIDWGYRAVHETVRVTKAIIEVYYGQVAEKSYFLGCSTGGRQGLMEAIRYPTDFDGIISGCPDLDVAGNATFNAWLALANTGRDGKNLITAAELPLIKEAVYKSCDALDGLEDGLISDPRDCQFDPEMLTCAEEKRDNCLLEAQVDALIKMYDGPRDSMGRQLFAGLPLGSEPYWDFWITGETGYTNDDLLRRAGLQFMRYMAFREDPGEQYTLADFDFDKDPQRLEFMDQIYSTNTRDLEVFREIGGKRTLGQIQEFHRYHQLSITKQLKHKLVVVKVHNIFFDSS